MKRTIIFSIAIIGIILVTVYIYASPPANPKPAQCVLSLLVIAAIACLDWSTGFRIDS